MTSFFPFNLFESSPESQVGFSGIKEDLAAKAFRWRCGVFWGIELPLAQACLYKSSTMQSPQWNTSKKMKNKKIKTST